MSVTNPETTVMHRVSQSLRELLVHHQHLVKYLIIGGVASGIDVVLFLVIFNVLGFSALISHSISVPTSVLFSFVVNARHNFRTSDYMWLRLLSFAIVAVIGYAAGYGVIAGAVYFGLGANIGKFLSLPVVFVIQYLLNSRITFRKGPAPGGNHMQSATR
jgi:putative flippase GtrA